MDVISIVSRSGEVVDALLRRKIDFCCAQETRLLLSAPPQNGERVQQLFLHTPADDIPPPHLDGGRFMFYKSTKKSTEKEKNRKQYSEEDSRETKAEFWQP